MTTDNSDYLSETPLLDYGHASLRKLIQDRGWESLPTRQRIGAVYTFVRDEISFGYNAGDRIPASRVLADGNGQCNTKTILLMALLRGVGIPCRLHGATIHKQLQKGVVTALWYRLAPTNIVHSWAEVPSRRPLARPGGRHPRYVVSQRSSGFPTGRTRRLPRLRRRDRRPRAAADRLAR